jgi:urea transport system permease protein
VGIINPSLFSPLFSVEMVVCVALGGRGTLYGAVIGAFTINFIKTWLTTAMPDSWLFALGAIFVLVTILLPQGIAVIFPRAGILLAWRRKGAKYGSKSS